MAQTNSLSYDAQILPGPLSGTIAAVASKSMAHRLLILASFAPGITNLSCTTTSQDIQATIACLEALGARITATREGYRVIPISLNPKTDTQRKGNGSLPLLDAHESGSTLRFMLPVAAALGNPVTFTGAKRLAARPLGPLAQELQTHGVTLEGLGSFPLHVTGKLKAGRFILPGTVSSQYISGLLMAAPLMEAPLEILVTKPVESYSYLKLTIQALHTFGIEVLQSSDTFNGHDVLVFQTQTAKLQTPASIIEVEGDWSNAGFWLAASAIGSPLTITGLNPQSCQGDRAMLFALSRFGAQISQGPSGITVLHTDLCGCDLSVEDIPDLVPPLALVACMAQGTTHISGAARLRLKESDRLQSVTAALSALGAHIAIQDDGLVIQGGTSLTGGTCECANDHRIAMMSSIAAAYAQGTSTLKGANCVNKSYPRFFEDFSSLGGNVQLCPTQNPQV